MFYRNLIHFLYEYSWLLAVCDAFYWCSTLKTFTLIVIYISDKDSLVTTSVRTICGRSLHVATEHIVYCTISFESEGIGRIRVYK